MQALLRHTREQQYPKGTVLFWEKEPPKGLFVVAEGEIKIFKMDDRGREVVLSIVQPGHAVAEMPVLDGGNYPASAQATQDSRLLFIARQAFLDLLQEHPEIALELLRVTAIQMRRLIHLVEQFSLQSVRSRLIHYLLDTARAQGNPFTLPDSKEAIAAQLGSVREVISRTFSALQQEGLIRIQGRQIYIPSPNALEQAMRSRES